MGIGIWGVGRREGGKWNMHCLMNSSREEGGDQTESAPDRRTSSGMERVVFFFTKFLMF